MQRLVAELAPILERHPVGARSHRPFVREFIRAVHAATGRTCSPVLYRRLLDVYAAGRTPSTATLDQEKKAFVAALAQQSRVERDFAVSRDGERLAELVQHAVDVALAKNAQAEASRRPTGEPISPTERDALQAQLTDIERRLQHSEARASRLAAELQAAVADRDAAQKHLTIIEAASAKHEQYAAQLLHEVGEQRRYAMRAINAAQGETRVWKEHCAVLEHKLVQALQQQEIFRQSANARIGEISDLLPKDPPP